MGQEENTVKRNYFKVHKYQHQALTSDKRFIALISGIQGGKTTTGCYWLIDEIYKSPTSNFIICADSYKRLEQSTLIKFFEIFPHDWGNYLKQQNVVELPEGGKIFIRSLDDPDALEGIPDVRAAWMDEGGKTKYGAWINFQGRLARNQGRGLITTTPYAFNWLYYDFYKKWLAGDPNYEVIQFQSIENPSFSQDEFERLKTDMSEADFQRKYCGVFARREGLVYYLDHDSIVEDIEYSNLTMYAGIDWGFTNPTAFVIIGVDSDLNYAQVAEYYETKKTTPELIEAAHKFQTKYKIKYWYADPEDPEKIAQFNRAGLRTIPAINDWEKGHSAVTEVLRNKRFQIIRGKCPNTLDEFESHHYPEGDEGREIKEKPVDANNHALSGVRYVIVSNEGGTGRIVRPSDRKPKNQVERIERLLSDKHNRRRRKDWYYA
jgi:PBSX family phage terminase large subunit